MNYTGTFDDNILRCFFLDSQVNCDDEYADIDWDKLGFSLIPTDYMYLMKCSQEDGFIAEGQLNPYGNLELSPASGALNYGQVS